jgi:anti-sigma factor RsiW
VVEIARGCQVFDEDLSAWIDGELAAPRRAAVEAHLASCRACTARLEALRAVDRAVLSLPEPAVGAGLGERLARRLAAERSSPPEREALPPPASGPVRIAAPRRRRYAPALALPLAAAAALALFFLLRPAGPPAGPAESVPIAQAPELPAPAGAPIASAAPEAPSVERARKPPEAEPQLAQRPAPAPSLGELEALDPEELAVALELDTIEDLPVIANLEVLERLLADEAG